MLDISRLRAGVKLTLEIEGLPNPQIWSGDIHKANTHWLIEQTSDLMLRAGNHVVLEAPGRADFPQPADTATTTRPVVVEAQVPEASVQPQLSNAELKRRKIVEKALKQRGGVFERAQAKEWFGGRSPNYALKILLAEGRIVKLAGRGNYKVSSASVVVDTKREITVMTSKLLAEMGEFEAPDWFERGRRWQLVRKDILRRLHALGVANDGEIDSRDPVERKNAKDHLTTIRQIMLRIAEMHMILEDLASSLAGSNRPPPTTQYGALFRAFIEVGFDISLDKAKTICRGYGYTGDKYGSFDTYRKDLEGYLEAWARAGRCAPFINASRLSALRSWFVRRGINFPAG